MKQDRPCPRPVLRYTGGKFRIAPQIVELMPAHDVYVEPYGGAASVLLAKAAAPCEVYNDIWGDVVNVFRQLRDSQEALLRGLFLTPYAREEYEGAYEPTTDRLEAARRFIFRSMAGLGSDCARRLCGFRTTLDDGRYAHAKSWAGMPEALAQVCDRLRGGVIIENRPAIEIMKQFDGQKTLHYIDPPYLDKTRKQTKRQYVHEMQTAEAHEELLNAVLELKGKVMLSGYASKLYTTKLKGWAVKKLQQRDQRNNPREEVVWMNYEPEAMLL